jgi:hypothetical protein
MVLAQQEARLLNHSFIGTEHILLGLIHEGEGVAAKALESLGISLELALDHPSEPATLGQLGPLGSQRPPTGCPIGHQGPILPPPAVGLHLPTHRRRRPAEGLSDGSDGISRRQPAGDLLAFFERESQFGTLAWGRPLPPSVGNELAQRHVLAAQMPGNALDRNPSLSHIPDRLALFFAKASPHPHTS